MHAMVDIEVSCLPGDLPDFIEVDLSELDVGGTLHLSEINLPQGLEIVALNQGEDHDLPVVSMIASKGVKEDS